MIKIKKGLDIPLKGAASGRTERLEGCRLFAIVPDDFPGYTWKAVVKPGDRVTAGDPLLTAKEDSLLSLTSPVAGEVKEIHRGQRRHIEYVSVETTSGDPTESREFKGGEYITLLKQSGLYAMMRQRPFDIVPLGDSPRDIFVTAFDTAPLAPGMDTPLVKEYLEDGLEVLATMTTGKVYLSVAAGSGLTSRHAEVNEFDGPHPAGNVGVQIAAIRPVNKGETVWALSAETAARIGKLIRTGRADYSTRVAITGSGVREPRMEETLIGASIDALLEGNLTESTDRLRIISGNVLTGNRVHPGGFLRAPYRQVTVIPEGADADEFMGWASLDPSKYSVKKTFPAFLRGLSKPFDFDARIKGGHRAMIMSGEYDKVFPFDIYPEYLIKAILGRDIEKMEQLGIYEVAPEDFALPEFVDTSKLELQKIVREGLDYLRKETL